jgi:CRISPR-associated endonuclease Csn1
LENSDVKYILNEISNEEFLIKQNNKANSMIPYQLNGNELNMIISNQGKFYPFLLDNFDKIKSLLTFRIPYYIGPLNEKSEFAWLVKKNNGPIYPWNFEEQIDIDQTAEKFIKRMLNKCTYLIHEDVIPKHSLLYSKFTVYNELNKIRVNGEFLSKDVRRKIIEELFLSFKKVTRKELFNWLKINKIIRTEDAEISGFQSEDKFATSLSSYIDFKKIFGDINQSNEDMIEQIIEWLTVFENKDIIKRKIKALYPHIQEEEMNNIIKLKYTGWSRLSRKLLKGIYTVDSYQNKQNIMDYLENTNMNLMEIIRDGNLSFKKIIDEEGKIQVHGKVTIDALKSLQGSPAIKRSIWQTIQIIQEIAKIMKSEPQNIYLEFARSDEKPARTSSRIDQLLKKYKDIQKESYMFDREILNQLKDLDKQINKELLLREKQDRLYLYYLQNGNCMYTMEPLEIDLLSQYDIDHLIPQSYIKDDSIDNRVLVKKIENQNKGGNLLPIEQVPKAKLPVVKAWWMHLKKYGLISERKFANLTETNRNEKREKGFINRQLVETRQISKHVAQILTQTYKNTNIQTIKAQLTSHFRNQFELYKNRLVNDFHHAHDAYITAIIGTFIHKRFPNLDSEFIYGEFKKYKSNLKQKGKFGFIISSMNDNYLNEDGEIIWNRDEVISLVKKTLNYKDCLVTKKIEEHLGQFYKMNPIKASEKDSKLNLKKELPSERYGGYTGEQATYFVVVNYKKNKKEVKKLVSLPIWIAKITEIYPDKLHQYLQEKLTTKEFVILRNRIGKYQLVETSDGLKYIVGEKEQHNALQLIIDSKYAKLIHQIESNQISSIDEKLLNELFEHYLDKLGLYYPIFKSTFNKLNQPSTKQEFYKLKLVSQDKKNKNEKSKIDVMNELFKLTRCKAENANLKLLGNTLSDREGRTTKTIDLKETYFIDQSITGLFQKRTKL